MMTIQTSPLLSCTTQNGQCTCSADHTLCIYGCGQRRRFNSLYCEFHYQEELYGSK